MAALESDVASAIADYAVRHRLRTRNLHDGRPVPPMRAASNVPTRGYAGADRWDAIIGRNGYIAAGVDRLEWMILAGGRGYLDRLLDRIRAVGAVVAQWGDAEAGGHAPVSALDRLVPLIRPFRRRPGRPDWRGQFRSRIDSNRSDRPAGTPQSKSTPIPHPCRDKQPSGPQDVAVID